jgi:hypothetical protein
MPESRRSRAPVGGARELFAPPAVFLQRWPLHPIKLVRVLPHERATGVYGGSAPDIRVYELALVIRHD